MSSLFRIALVVALTLVLSGCAHFGRYSLLAPVERSLIFQPVRYPDGDWEPSGLYYEDARFEAQDGTDLHGWFAKTEHED